MRMRSLCDVLWNAFGDRGYSWCGFYVYEPGAAGDGPGSSPGEMLPGEMLLAARQPKPACSPIGLDGICGQSWKQRQSVLVRDVRTLDANSYIACDPRDVSEVVVPMVLGGECWGVLDVDSYEVGAFDEHDARGLLNAAQRAGLCDELEFETIWAK